MRYFLHWEDSLDRRVCDLLKAELSRFDIRAEFLEPVELKKSNEADVIIFITSRSKKSVYALPTFTIHISAKRNRSYSGSSSKNQTIYLDLPVANYQRAEYLGCPLFDVFKHLKVTPDAVSNEARVPIVAGYNSMVNKGNLTRLKRQLAVKHAEVGLRVADIESELESLIIELQNANAAIAPSKAFSY